MIKVSFVNQPKILVRYRPPPQVEIDDAGDKKDQDCDGCEYLKDPFSRHGTPMRLSTRMHNSLLKSLPADTDSLASGNGEQCPRQMAKQTFSTSAAQAPLPSRTNGW